MSVIKQQKLENRIALFFIIIMICVIGYHYIQRGDGFPYVKAGDAKIYVAIADEAHEREQGLSYYKNMEPDSGMLFVFERPDKHQIWMKDMYLDLDILWLDRNRKVVHIKENALPESYPEVFTPNKDASFVLEVPAGWVQSNNIQLGQKLKLINI